MMGNMRTEAHSAFFSSLFLCQKAGRKRMNRKIRTYLLMGLFLTAVGGMEQVSAAEGQVYDLAPVTVTATRYASKDLNVGESTQIVTSEQLQQTGQTNLQQALSFLDSVVYNSMGSNGTAASSMTSKIIIRGVEDGTLVMINGTPVNWRRKYNLEDIPLESIEKVEVIRGGGAVLYGSQATGGVINIITKKKLPNQVQAGLGNYGQQDYKVSANAGDFSFAYHYNKWGDTGLISSTWPSADYPVRTKTSKEMRMRFKKAEKNDFLATYKINDSLDSPEETNLNFTDALNFVAIIATFGFGYLLHLLFRRKKLFFNEQEIILSSVKRFILLRSIRI